jgi:hypothetical protein
LVSIPSRKKEKKKKKKKKSGLNLLGFFLADVSR